MLPCLYVYRPPTLPANVINNSYDTSCSYTWRTTQCILLRTITLQISAMTVHLFGDILCKQKYFPMKTQLLIKLLKLVDVLHVVQ